MRRKNGFTIVELIVVLAVIGILAAVLIPVFQGAIEDANRAKQTAELDQLNKALTIHVTLNGEDSLYMEDDFSGQKILSALKTELKLTHLPVDLSEEEFLAYDVTSGKIKVFQSGRWIFNQMATCPDRILQDLVLLEEELLESFYTPLVSGGSFENFLNYVDGCQKPYAAELRRYAADRIFIGQKDGKDQVLTVNGGQDLIPVFGKTVSNVLPEEIYQYVSADTAIETGLLHPAGQLFEMAREKTELLGYRIDKTDLTLGACTLQDLILSWEVASFQVETESQKIILFDQNGTVDFEPQPVEPDDPGPEKFEWTLRIVKLREVNKSADISLFVEKSSGKVPLTEVSLAAGQDVVSVTLSEELSYGDKLMAKLTGDQNYFQAGWYLASDVTLTLEGEQRTFYWQRGLQDCTVTEGETELELWLVPSGDSWYIEDFTGRSFIPDLSENPDVLVSFESEFDGYQKMYFLLEEQFTLKKFGVCSLTPGRTSTRYSLTKVPEESLNLNLYSLEINLIDMYSYQMGQENEMLYNIEEYDLYHIAKIGIE